jgi:hypothetical protein
MLRISSPHIIIYLEPTSTSIAIAGIARRRPSCYTYHSIAMRYIEPAMDNMVSD